MKTITGPFKVKLEPIKTAHNQSNLGRMSIDKTFEGPLSGRSKGEMLTAMTSVQSSAGYVAIEHFEGSLEGKVGSFTLQHFGIMNDGNERLILEVVPDSGTGDLKGISGTMKIERDGGHRYVFDYNII